MERKKPNTIDFNDVVTKEELLLLPEEKRDFAVKQGIYHRKYIESTYGYDYLASSLSLRAREIAFLANKYRMENNVTKELLAATIALPKDESIIRVLLSKNITYNNLVAYSRAISNLKKIAMLAKEIEPNEELKLANKKITNLCRLIKMYYGVSDFNLVLAKLNYLVAFKMDLYLEIEEKLNLDKQKKF